MRICLTERPKKGKETGREKGKEELVHLDGFSSLTLEAFRLENSM